MDKDLFNKTLSNHSSLQQINVTELESLVNSYPYLQSARALLLKIYKHKESYKYNHFLKSTAAFTTDRSILFEYITSKKFKQEDISKSLKQNINNLKNKEIIEEEPLKINKVEDKNIQQLINDTDGVLNPDLFETKHTEKILKNKEAEEEENLEPQEEASFFETIILETENINETKVEETQIEDDIDFTPLKIGKPLEFDINEQYSFSEWLKITSLKPIKRQENTTKETVTKDTPFTITTKENIITNRTENNNTFNEKLAIIDKFLESNPKIKPPSKTAPKPKLIDQDLTLEDSLMTETLARIYVEQKNFDKAIQAYKILSLKYPEKSSFFAHQIFLIETLKDKNNSSDE